MKTDEQIAYGNKLIAEYMGMKWIGVEWVGDMRTEFAVSEANGFGTTVSRYHESWEWLMEVIEKISQTVIYTYEDGTKVTAAPTTFGMLNEYGESMCRLTSFPLFTAGTLIEAVYDAVVYFVQNQPTS